MRLSRPDLVAIERAAIASWPALVTFPIGGWLARWSSGGSVRANTVAALDCTCADLDAALAQVEAFYRAKGGTPKFTITDVVEPHELDVELQARGWTRTGDHVTMAKDVASGTAKGQAALPSGARPVDVEVLDRPSPDWSSVYLQGVSDSRRGIAMRLVEGTPVPRAFFLARRDGEAIASGLTVVDGGLASVQCMATLAAERRTGAAAAVLAALEQHVTARGARRLYLQTDAANHPAVSLYRRVGFAIIGRYHTRELAI